MIAPLVLGLTYNGAKDVANGGTTVQIEQTVRVPFTLAHDATRFQVSLAPGQQDAEEASRWVTTVTLVGAHVGVHAGGGVMSEIVHSWDGADLSSGAWLSTWADEPLQAGVEYVLSFAYTNPNSRLVAAGTMAAYRNPSAAEHANVGGGTWALDTMRVGPMSPAIVYDTAAAPPVVPVVGDSNAAGRGAHLPYHEAFAHVAARATGAAVIPLGYTGETLTDWSDHPNSPKWTRVLGLAGRSTADAVIVQGGFNDLNIGRSSTVALGNLDLVVARARQIAPVVHVATIPPGGLVGGSETNRRAYNDAIRAGGHGDGVIDLDAVLRSPTDPSKLATEYAGTDAVHYGTAGHEAAADALVPLLTSLTSPAEPDGWHVLASGQTAPLAGTDIERPPSASIVRYTRTAAQTVTPTNMWGVEVTVRGGVVTAVNDRNTTSAPATPIPQDGYVLSGNFTLRSWLIAHAPLGASVSIEPGIVDNPGFSWPVPLDERAPSTVTVGGATVTLTNVNGPRAVGELTLYTDLLHIPPTNRWGIEVVVQGGTVVEVVDRATTGAPQPAIPAGGFVLSGHGASRTWLLEHAPVGADVTVTGDATYALSATAGGLGLAAPATDPTAPLPPTVVGAYVNLRIGPPLAEVGKYNVLFAAFATSRDGQTMLLETPGLDTAETLKAAIARDKARGARWILSMGGGVELARQTFVRTREAADVIFSTLTPIIDEYGFQGVDYNLENGPGGFTADALLYLSGLLRARYGASFAITMTPRPFENFFLDIAAEHESAGLLDALQLQFYDVPETRHTPWLREWVRERTAAAHAAGVPYSKIVLGAIPSPAYARGGNTAATYASVLAEARARDGVRGVFVWDAAIERDGGYRMLLESARLAESRRVERAALPVGAVIFREPARGRRVALRNPANGRYLGQASPVARLFAPEDPAWQWAELPDDTGAVMATYPYPIAPTGGGPMLLTEGPVVTGNATGLGPAGSSYSWAVERASTRPSITTGPLLRAHTTGAGTPLTVTLTITPPNGVPTTVTRQVTCLSMGGGRGRHQADIGGRARTLDVRFTAPTTGTYRVLWEQLDTHAQLIPRSARLSTVTLTAGQTHTPALTVTPPVVGARRTYAWRAIIEDPTGGVHVSHTVYDAVHPGAVTAPVGDDRLPVPAGPLALQVGGFPNQAPGDDATNPAMTQAQAVAAFTSQILAGGMVLNAADFGIPVASVDMSALTSMVPIDGQHKMAPDYGWPLSTWGQLVAPAVIPPGVVQASGSDATLGLYDPATHDYSESWITTLDERGRLRATQGGHENLLTSDGRWTRPGAGVSAAGFLQGPHALSLHTVQACLARLSAGQGFDDLLTHALLVALPQVRGPVNGQRVHAYPATRTDGTGPTTAPLMGARFRLSSTVDMAAWSPLARVIGRALQLYGCVISDTTGGGAAIICRAYPERMMGGRTNPWNDVFPAGRGWSEALPEIGSAAAWRAVRPGYQATVPTSPIMPPPTGLADTGETETVVVDGATVHFTNLEG